MYAYKSNLIIRMKISFFIKQKNLDKNGFSLIEVIFSIGIITVGLVSILSLFINNIKTEISNKNKLISIYLANESIEIVRQKRDNIWFSGSDAFMGTIPIGDVIVGLNDKTDIRKGWKIMVSNANRKKVYLSNGSYIQYEDSPLPADGWTETGFERYLTATYNFDDTITGCLGAIDCMEITSHVFFNGIQIVKITAYLYDGWY